VQRVLIVFGAGGAGCVVRYLVNLAVGQRAFPYATLIVNLVGSFLIAFVVELALLRKDLPVHLQLALTTGFLGGFTTYSAFNVETTRLVLDGHTARGIVNVGATLVGGIAAGLLGLWMARRIALS
jgi:fluoride exporter